jgi:hypothetical protein
VDVEVEVQVPSLAVAGLHRRYRYRPRLRLLIILIHRLGSLSVAMTKRHQQAIVTVVGMSTEGIRTDTDQQVKLSKGGEKKGVKLDGRMEGREEKGY